MGMLVNGIRALAKIEREHYFNTKESSLVVKMTRKSKPARRRARCPRKRIPVALKTNQVHDKSCFKLKPSVNALEGSLAVMAFVPKYR